tara:strand:+ start:387 stop:3065 length:2679 start_codon:yes stop_codon:yes gene_type:complete
MAKFTDKISNLINSQAPEFVVTDHPKFLEFVKSYFTFMESAEISVTSVQTSDGIGLESELNTDTSTLLLDASRLDTDRTQLDAGDKVILESSTYGKFTRGETVTGQTSKATAIILKEDLANGKLYISAQNKFIEGESLVGASSNATAILGDYKPNPVNTIQQLLEFRDPDKVISNFLTKFRNEFLNTIPENLDGSVDKRKLIKNIKSVYRAKGTNRGHEIFFRMLFGLPSETIYPRENMLRISDGKWTTNKILRAIAFAGSDTSLLIGRTITGQSSGATAIVEAVSKFQIGANEITEFTLGGSSIQGTFQTGEEVRGTQSDDASVFIKATTSGIPGTISITNDGFLSAENDSVPITGGGTGSIIQVNAIGNGGLTDFIIDDAGTGYEIGDDLVFNNANTDGGGAVAKVSLVNGGLTPEDSTSTTDDHIILEDETVRGDSYTGNKVVQEAGTGINDITDIRIINPGSNYTTLPTITVNSPSETGNGAKILANGTNIGRVLGLKIVEPGAEYHQSPTPPTLSVPGVMILKDITGTFVADQGMTSLDSSSSTITATSVSFNSTLQTLKFKAASGTFQVGRTITLANGATATIARVQQATATTTVTAVGDTNGAFINEDGHISDDAMRIQDSLYYQDFSYVIKVGRAINDWRDSFKKTMHTAGFYFTGQVNIESRISAQISQPVDGQISGISESPIFGVISQLFSTIFGRRLGTVDDGTSQRANAQQGVDPDFDDSTSEHFTPNTRDVTLRRLYTIKLSQSSTLYNITSRGDTYLRGFAYGGPTMKRLQIGSAPFSSSNMYSGTHTLAQTTAIAGGIDGTNKYISPLKLVNWADHRVTGFSDTDIDGERFTLAEYDIAQMKQPITIPTEIVVSVPGTTFDTTTIKFDTTTVTFDQT